MAYYMAFGSNGVIVVNSWGRVLNTRKYLIGNNNRKYDTYREAEKAALEHLRDIAPEYLSLPDHIVLNRMLTLNQLNEMYLKKEGEKCEKKP